MILFYESQTAYFSDFDANDLLENQRPKSKNEDTTNNKESTKETATNLTIETTTNLSIVDDQNKVVIDDDGDSMIADIPDNDDNGDNNGNADTSKYCDLSFLNSFLFVRFIVNLIIQHVISLDIIQC